MKTRELIAELNRLDPSGEMECVAAHWQDVERYEKAIPIIAKAWTNGGYELATEHAMFKPNTEVSVIVL